MQRTLIQVSLVLALVVLLLSAFTGTSKLPVTWRHIIILAVFVAASVAFMAIGVFTH